MKFSEQQERAIETKKNCIVAAGAGSGKTAVLSERFMRLVKEGSAHCDEILTITFTKKATAEMKSRIHKTLMEAGLSDELRRFSSASISTVDGFCSSIAKSDCQRYGLTSDFSIFDEIELEETTKKLARKFLNQQSSKRSVIRLVSCFGSSNSVKLLSSLAKSYFDFIHPINAQSHAEEVLSFCKNKFEQSSEMLQTCCETFISSLSEFEKEKPNIDIVKKMLICAEHNDFDELKKLKIDGRLGSKEAKAIVNTIREKLEDSLDEFVFYGQALNQEEDVLELYELVSDFEKLFTSEKRRMGCLTFSDVMKLTIDILITNKTIRSKYKQKFKYIMIDEFQDDNKDYRDLLYLLSEKPEVSNDEVPDIQDLSPEKIFLVGDEKQSIYRFRGADVCVFKSLCDEIDNVIELSTNYRSKKPLVDTFNRLFSRVMKNNGMKYEADFKGLDSDDEKAFQSKVIFHNFLHPHRIDYSAYGFECTTPVQSEAYGIANLIKRMLDTDDFLIEKNGKTVRPSEGDIAILLKSSTRQCDYEKALRLKGIGYSITESRSLFTEALFNDFYNLLQICIYSYDRTSLIAFLKSPFCRLTDREILSLDLDNLPQEYQRIIDSVCEKLASSSLTQTLDFIYYDLGYRNFLISNPANQVYCEHYDFLYALFSKFENSGKGLTQVLDYIRPLLGTTDKITELTTFREENDGVHIMTIHKSKGLGFPIVIVAGMQAGSSNNNVVNINNDFNVLYFNCIENSNHSLSSPLYKGEKNHEMNQDEAELKRLFYVAATRACCHIVFSADISESEIKEDSKNSMVKMLVDAAGFDFKTQKSANFEMDGIPFDLIDEHLTFSSQRMSEQKLNECESWYENCQSTDFNWKSQTVAVTSLVDEQTDMTCQKLKSVNSDDIIIKNNIQTDFGTLVHAFIENHIKKISEPELKTSANLSEPEVLQITEDARKLANGFLNSKLYTKIKDYELYPEREFFMKKDEIILNGKIDLLAISENEAVVIDFKTDIIKDEKQHIKQLSYYRDAVSSVYPDKEVKCYVFYLREQD